MPGLPQSVNVTSPNSTTLLVTWDHPLAPDRNGVITGYTVIRQKGSEIVPTELFSNDTSQLLVGLVPFTEYSITVAGNTSAGRREFTVPVTMQTLKDSECARNADNALVQYVCLLWGSQQKHNVHASTVCMCTVWSRPMCVSHGMYFIQLLT